MGDEDKFDKELFQAIRDAHAIEKEMDAELERLLHPEDSDEGLPESGD
ncbi:hypothetical protein ACPPVQ_13665 [Diaminobutyricibacter sp. McL0618]